MDDVQNGYHDAELALFLFWLFFYFIA